MGVKRVTVEEVMLALHPSLAEVPNRKCPACGASLKFTYSKKNDSMFLGCPNYRIHQEDKKSAYKGVAIDNEIAELKEKRIREIALFEGNNKILRDKALSMMADSDSEKAEPVSISEEGPAYAQRQIPISSAPEARGVRSDSPNSIIIQRANILCADLDKSLFKNSRGNEEIEVVFVRRIPRLAETATSGFGPALVDVSSWGIIIATDMEKNGETFGHHNYFIPWTNVAAIRQKASK